MSRLILPGILKVKGEQVFNGGIFNGLEYQLVTNPVTGRVWLDRNLGATRVATAVNDAEAYGWLYQWGRLSDGHQLRDSAERNEQSTSDVPEHSDFIIGFNDWRNPSNNDLWQGLEGINNPCPPGFRLPTLAEWEEEQATWGDSNISEGYESILHIPETGRRRNTDGGILNIDRAYYWTGDASGSTSIASILLATGIVNTGINRSFGCAIRPIKHIQL